MSRPKVPHCKECNNLEDKNQKYSYYSALRKQYGCWYCTEQKRYIDGQEVRTSPKWCNKRHKMKF